ncbi:MAG: hypothetical protein ACFCU3_10050 [Verrucomicrobiales bacterium]
MKSHHPLSVYGQDIPAPLLLCLKSETVLSLTRHRSVDPFLGLAKIFDAWSDQKLPGAIVLTTASVARVGLTFNFHPRLMSFCVAVSELLPLLWQQQRFATTRCVTVVNHVYGCLVQTEDELEWPRRQISLVYASAATNKLFSANWRSGQFMHNLMGNIAQDEIYLSINKRLGAGKKLGKAICWSVILMEYCLATCWLIPRLRRWVFFPSMLFHVGMLIMTRGGLSWPFLRTALAFFSLAAPIPKQTALVPGRKPHKPKELRNSAKTIAAQLLDPDDVFTSVTSGEKVNSTGQFLGALIKLPVFYLCAQALLLPSWHNSFPTNRYRSLPKPEEFFNSIKSQPRN